MNVRRMTLFIAAMLALTLVYAPAQAQEVDLGNDGIDMNCDDFPERNAVEGYFREDGGSAERNVDGLDPDGNGIPCDEEDFDDGSDDADGDDGSDDADGEDDEPVVELPATGAGATGGEGSLAIDSLIAVTSVIALLLAVASRLWFQRSSS